MNSNDRDAQQRFDEDAQARAARDQEITERRREDDDKRKADLAEDDKERARLYDKKLDDRARADKARARADDDKRTDESTKGRQATDSIREEPALAWMADNYREVEANRNVETFDVLDNQRAFEAALEKSGVHSRTRTDEIAIAEQRRILNHGAEAEREGFAQPERGREDGPEDPRRGDGPGTRPDGPDGKDGPLEPASERKVREIPDFQALEMDARTAREREERGESHIRT